MKAGRIASSLIILLAAAVLVPAGSAAAEPPQPVDSTPFFAPAGEVCDFPVIVTSTGKTGFIPLPHNPRFFGLVSSPDLKITTANAADPTRSVTVNATGLFHLVSLPDGGVEIIAGGHNYLFAPELGITAIATTGPIVLRSDAEGFPVAADTSRAQVFDVCAAIS
jgi:hypothetical protein